MYQFLSLTSKIHRVITLTQEMKLWIHGGLSEDSLFMIQSVVLVKSMDIQIALYPLLSDGLNRWRLKLLLILIPRRRFMCHIS
jgi:hypothetical protein